MPNSSQLPDQNDSLSNRVIGDQVRLLAINQLDERLERYRLAQPKLEQQMLKSFRDYGQLSPVVVCQLDGQTVLVDGLSRFWIQYDRTGNGSGAMDGQSVVRLGKITYAGRTRIGASGGSGIFGRFDFLRSARRFFHLFSRTRTLRMAL